MLRNVRTVLTGLAIAAALLVTVNACNVAGQWLVSLTPAGQAEILGRQQAAREAASLAVRIERDRADWWTEVWSVLRWPLLATVAIAVPVAVALGLVMLVDERQRRRRDGQLYWPNLRNQWPVETPTQAAQLAAVHATGHATARIERARAAAQPPHILHQHQHGGGQTPVASQAPPGKASEGSAPPLALPPAMTLGQALTWQPSLDCILLAVNQTGQPLVAPAGGLCHVALAGTTGGGKSTIMRLLVGQLLAAGADVALADPHYTSLDIKSGDDWRMIEPRLIDRPAIEASEIEELLRWTVAEVDRRLELRRRQQPVGRPLFLAVDELPAIMARIPKTPSLLGQVLREGRKVGVLLTVASHDFLVDTIGGNSGARECYRTAYYVGGDDKTARVMLDRRGTIDEAGLGKGVVMLRSPATPTAQLARVPLVTNDDLYRLLPSTGERSATIEPNAPFGLNLSERSTVRQGEQNVIIGDFSRTNERDQAQIRAAIAAGEPKQATLSRLFGVKKGDNPGWRRYSAAWDAARARHE